MIIEDEPLAREILEGFISETPSLQLIDVAKTGEEALRKLREIEVDLIFLDVNLPRILGIDVYKSLVKKPAVVFTTAYPEYAVEGFEMDAIDYLLKPFSFERFQSAVQKVERSLSVASTDAFLLVKEDKKLYRIPYEEIRYIESLGDYARIHARSQTRLSSDTLKVLAEKLPNSKFRRVHKSYIVSIDAISYMEGNQLVLDNQKIPVGQAYREEISRLFKA
jgi:DNA-binding LytR/AlgR family response regulator